MMKLEVMLIALGILSCAPIFAQRIIKNPTSSCSQRKADLPVVGKLRLGSHYSEIQEIYPNLKPIAGENTYITTSPYEEFSQIMLRFAPNRTLISYTLVYPDKLWESIELPVSEALKITKLSIPRTQWTIWAEGENRTITVQCSDFAVVSTLSLRGSLKRFIFTVADKSTLSQPIGQGSGIGASRPTVPSRFPDRDSEFTIEFAKSPSLETSTSELGKKLEASLSHRDNGNLRAEYLELPAEVAQRLRTASSEQLNSLALEAGRTLGLQGIEVSHAISNLGPSVSIRGFKFIDGTHATIDMIMYFGNRSIFTVITIGATRDIPDPEAIKFKASVRKRLQS